MLTVFIMADCRNLLVFFLPGEGYSSMLRPGLSIKTSLSIQKFISCKWKIEYDWNFEARYIPIKFIKKYLDPCGISSHDSKNCNKVKLGKLKMGQSVFIVITNHISETEVIYVVSQKLPSSLVKLTLLKWYEFSNGIFHNPFTSLVSLHFFKACAA